LEAPKARNVIARANGPGHARDKAVSAESAKFESIPNVTFIVRDLVTLEERTQLILKSNAMMMLFLILDIAL
jgi:hypothetical protein